MAEQLKSTIAIGLESTDLSGGDTIRGKVSLVAREHIPARGVRLALRGVETSIRHTGMGRSMRQESETAIWFDDELTLFGEPRIEGVALLGDAVKGLVMRDRYAVIEPGEYDYEFEYALPDTLPGDYESTRGDIAIRYELRAYVDIPLRVDLETARNVTIYETRRHADDESAAEVKIDKKCILHKDGHVHLGAAIDHKAYKLGDEISLTLDIDNQCAELVDGLIIGLKQTETVAVQGSKEGREVVLAAQTHDKCKAAPGEQESYSLTYRVAPELYPTIEQGKLINVGYALHVEAVVDLATNAVIDIPIRLYEQPGAPGGQGELPEEA